MTINSIFLLAPAEFARPEEGPIAFAVALAAKAGAKLTIFCVALDVTSPGSTVDAIAAGEKLMAAAAAHGVDATLVSEHSHAVGIHEVVAEHARLHDISVSGINSEGLLSERQIAEYLMFESGRPVLLVPSHWRGEVVTDKLCVAWDNSRSSARALSDAFHVVGCDNVVFLSITDEKALASDLDPDDMVRAARRGGLVATTASASLAGRDIGNALQAEAIASGAGLLAMGAFGHSRLRSFVLGSATRGILADLKMPVLLSH